METLKEILLQSSHWAGLNANPEWIICLKLQAQTARDLFDTGELHIFLIRGIVLYTESIPVTQKPRGVCQYSRGIYRTSTSQEATYQLLLDWMNPIFKYSHHTAVIRGKKALSWQNDWPKIIKGLDKNLDFNSENHLLYLYQQHMNHSI